MTDSLVGAAQRRVAADKKRLLDIMRGPGQGQLSRSWRLADLPENRVKTWRHNDPVFSAELTAIKEEFGNLREFQGRRDSNIYDPARTTRGHIPLTEFVGDYFGFPIWPHQQPIIQAWEDHTNLIIICLGPPGSGKDTLTGFIATQRAVEDRNSRIAWIMENEKFSRRRISQRLEPYLIDPRVYGVKPQGPDTHLPLRSLIDDYGPFKWDKGMLYPDGTDVEKTVWNQHEKYFVGNEGEADPNLWATGIDGALYGARITDLFTSDVFTRENQRMPTQRIQQMDLINGTLESRLDDAGRWLHINTRTADNDNNGVILKDWVEGARIVHMDGYYTKYSNGVATVIWPAIQVNEAGKEVSYWPEKFPLDDYIQIPGGESKVLAELSNDEQDKLLMTPGAKRRRGLRGIRERKPDMFETMYQQRPPAASTGEFSDALLNHCDDPTRTFGVVLPGEVTILGVDPARHSGAAYWVWAYNRETEVATLVDYFFGTRLGVTGIRDKLLLEPIYRYMPRWAEYEDNTSAAVMMLPEVVQAVKETGTQLSGRTTGRNRNEGEASVASVALEMQGGFIKFPAATIQDRQRLQMVKQQIQNWDAATIEARTRPGSSAHEPDDIFMAGWIGYLRIWDLRRRGSKISDVLRRPVPPSVLRRWDKVRAKKAEKVDTVVEQAPLEEIFAMTGDDT